MKWLFQPLLLLVARSTESELAKQVEFLKAENQILRKRLPRCLFLSLNEWSRTWQGWSEDTGKPLLCRESVAVVGIPQWNRDAGGTRVIIASRPGSCPGTCGILEKRTPRRRADVGRTAPGR
jgi:putative transposase